MDLIMESGQLLQALHSQMVMLRKISQGYLVTTRSYGILKLDVNLIVGFMMCLQADIIGLAQIIIFYINIAL